LSQRERKRELVRGKIREGDRERKRNR